MTFQTGHLACALACVLTLVGCSFGGGKKEAPPSGETFGADDTYSRTYKTSTAQACESVRRALLGQGYVVEKAGAESVEATKSFQPDAETHTQLVVRATCLAQNDGEALVFVNAVQDRYALKTTSNSASVGVGMVGSVSLPIGSSGAQLAKVGSSTVQNQDFYRRFFDRVKYYLPPKPGEKKAPPPEAEPAAPPDPAPPLPAAPVPAVSPDPSASAPASTSGR